MSTTAKEMFDKIEKLEELKRLWTDVCKNKIEVHIKVGNSDKLILLPEKIQNEKVYCRLNLSTEDLNTKINQEVIGQFFLGGDKYFFKTPCEYQDPFVVILVKTALYKLQRRQNFRLKVPDVFQSQFNLLSVNGNARTMKLQIWDLSSGGCCLHSEKDVELKIGDKIKSEMTLGRRQTLVVDGVIRHVRTEIQDKKKNILIGVQFSPISPALDSQLFTVMMELSRQYLRA